MTQLTKKQKKRRLKLSTIAKRNPNFQLAAYPKIHKMKLNERLLQTLERNDVDRPKAMKEKQEILQKFGPEMEHIPEVKSAMRDELKRRKRERCEEFRRARLSYHELLEFIHTRYQPERPDAKERAVTVSALDKKIIGEHELKRVPVDLERRFMEILHVILEDGWQLPRGYQWIEVLEFLQAFTQQSQLFAQDNALKDCCTFFRRVSQLLNFEQEFAFRYQQQCDANERLSSQPGPSSDPRKASAYRDVNRLMLNPNSALSIAVSTDPTLAASMIKAVNQPINVLPSNQPIIQPINANSGELGADGMGSDYEDEFEQVEEARDVEADGPAEGEEEESVGVEAGVITFDLEGLAREAARRDDHGLGWQDA